MDEIRYSHGWPFWAQFRVHQSEKGHLENHKDSGQRAEPNDLHLGLKKENVECDSWSSKLPMHSYLLMSWQEWEVGLWHWEPTAFLCRSRTTKARLT